MNYAIKFTTRFKKDFKRLEKRGKDMSRLFAVVELLRRGEELPAKYCDHALAGDFVGHRDCHIEPDWILIYYKTDETLVLTLTRTGSHADLF